MEFSDRGSQPEKFSYPVLVWIWNRDTTYTQHAPRIILIILKTLDADATIIVVVRAPKRSRIQSLVDNKGKASSLVECTGSRVRALGGAGRTPIAGLYRREDLFSKRATSPGNETHLAHPTWTSLRSVVVGFRLGGWGDRSTMIAANAKKDCPGRDDDDQKDQTNNETGHLSSMREETAARCRRNRLGCRRSSRGLCGCDGDRYDLTGHGQKGGNGSRGPR